MNDQNAFAADRAQALNVVGPWWDTEGQFVVDTPERIELKVYR